MASYTEPSGRSVAAERGHCCIRLCKLALLLRRAIVPQEIKESFSYYHRFYALVLLRPMAQLSAYI